MPTNAASSCSSSATSSFRASWSQQATNIVVSKYFRGQIGTPERERSVKQLIGRVVDTITRWAREEEYFASEDDLQAFSDDLKHLLVYQKGSFNSPVWFNCGFERAPQCSACFINSVQDTMESILTLAKTEGMLFKFGSGTGSNLSAIRSSREVLAGGGTASGPVSFMKGFDAFAGVIKSGGKTRRAAKMVILNADHPDIVEFINCKVEEEKKAWALIDAGYDGSFTGPAYASVFFQNSNNSVRVTDEFMRAVLDDGEWQTRSVTTGEVMDTYKARDLMRQIAEATWVCGDPGMQFDTTVNDWHTCPNTARINACNPCSEYMFLDDSACNLASINLMKFVGEDGEFDARRSRKACETFITAQEILVDNASYPTPAIEKNSHDYRPLGLGYANLGALLMSRGLPYDSDAGRDYAAAITAVMHGAAYAQSARVARDHGGPFPGYAEEPRADAARHAQAPRRAQGHRSHARPEGPVRARQARLGRVRRARRAARLPQRAGDRARADRHDRLHDGLRHDRRRAGHRARQVQEARRRRLDEDRQQHGADGARPSSATRTSEIKDIIDYIDENETIEGAPHLKDEHLPVFDCAFKPSHGVRSIHYMGHIKMMGAVQPFISGAISKTVNVPKAATVEEIEQAYIDAWRIGAKAVSIYRDGSKRTQPLNTSKDKLPPASRTAAAAAGPRRHRLPDERQSITHKFDIGGHEGYITVGLYEDGQPGELFLTMAKEGSTISGFADAFAQAISYALQYGVPLQDLVDKFSHVRFEPAGMTKNPDIRFAKSIVDYIFRWLAAKFLSPEAQYRAGVNNREEVDDARAARARRDGRGRPRAAGPSGRAGRRRQRASVERIEVRGDSEPGRRAAVLDVRLDHGALGRLLQVPELRHDERVRVGGSHPSARRASGGAISCSRALTSC